MPESAEPELWVAEAARLLRQHDRTGEVPALLVAVAHLRSALETVPAGAEPEPRGRYLTLLCVAARRLAEETGDVGLLREAVAVGRESIELTAASDAWHGRRLANFGDALLRLYERTGDRDALGESADVLREAAEESSGRTRAVILMNRSVAERHLGVETRDDERLRTAIAVGHEGIALLASDSSDTVGLWSNLGMAYRALYETTGDLSVLHEAVNSGRAALGLLADTHPQWPGRQHNLGISLRHLYEESGDIVALEQAIQAHRASLTPGRVVGRPQEAVFASALSVVLYRRFERRGDSGDLREAISAARRAVDAAPEDLRKLTVRLVALGSILVASHERTGSTEDLAEALAAARRAVAAAPGDHPDRTDALALLTSALQHTSDLTGDAAHIEEAVAQACQAVAETPVGYPGRSAHLANLGAALLRQYDHSGDAAQLREAAATFRQARLQTAADHSGRPNRLLNMGYALVRAGETGPNRLLDRGHTADQAGETRPDPVLAEEAHAVFREASAPTAPPAIRIRAHQADARLAALTGDWQAATDQYAAAVGILPQTAARHLARVDREHQLAGVAGLASEAAAAALNSDCPEKAVVLLEHGRGVILNEDFAVRGGIAELRRVDDRLAEEFIKVRTLLNISDTDSVELPGAAARRLDLEERWRTVLDRIHALPGMADFLSPPAFETLASHADAGPLVFVTVGGQRSDALLVTAEYGLISVPLPDAPYAVVQQRTEQFLTAVDADPARQDVILDVLAWLWDAVAEPVLKALGITGIPALATDPPRLWWCPTGLLSLLPLHAAGHHLAPGKATVLDRAVSSYAPTIQALAHARRPRSAGSPASSTGDVLVVAMPKTPHIVGANDLPGARRESAMLKRLIPGRTRELIGETATSDAVLAALPNARWAHFACHAVSEPDDPSAGRLLLFDNAERPLTVADVARLNLDHAELAFLSACSTSRPGTRLTDEAIHLASAFHVIGYRHVISTLWPVNDRIAVRIAEDVYGRLTKADGLSDGPAVNRPADLPVASALHRTALRFREIAPDSPSAWAAHVHSGA